MIKDDFTTKMSDKFTSLIKELKDVSALHSDKLSLIDTSFKKFVGLSSSIVNSMCNSDILELMKRNDKLDGNYCLITAALLFEEALVFEGENKVNEAYLKYEKAFFLIYNMKALSIECEIAGYESFMENIASSMENFHLPLEAKNNLIHYYELNSQYSKAEDNLYDLLEEADNKSLVKEKLKTFYAKLLEKDDAKLAAGNLPREEILEAMEGL